MGSTHHRSAVLKRLRESIEKTKDPETLAKLTAQYVKLNAQKRPRKPADVPSAVESKGKPSLLDPTGNSFVDSLPDEQRLIHHLVVRLEKHKKRTGQSSAEAEKEVIDGLSEEDRVLVKAFGLVKDC